MTQETPKSLDSILANVKSLFGAYAQVGFSTGAEPSLLMYLEKELPVLLHQEKTKLLRDVLDLSEYGEAITEQSILALAKKEGINLEEPLV